MTISVLIPSYDAEHFIVDAIGSVLAALGEQDRILLQDGSPSDATEVAVRRAFPEEPRIDIVREHDNGQSDALNRALARADSDYVLWLNADDVVDTENLRKDLSVLASSAQTDLLIAGHRVLRADGEVLGTYRGRALDRDAIMRRGCYIFSGSIIIRTSVLRTIGGFNPDLHFCMDLDLMFRLALRPDLLTVIVPEPLGALRRHDDSKSGTSAAKFRKEAWAVRGTYARGLGDQLSRAWIAIEQPIVSAAKPIRFSRPYRVLRDNIWRRNG